MKKSITAYSDPVLNIGVRGGGAGGAAAPQKKFKAEKLGKF